MAFSLLVLSACGLFDAGEIEQSCEDTPEGCATSDGGGDGGTTGTITIAVDAVEPAYGVMDGGDTVTITGGPFAADAVVTFGTREASLRTWKETELLVQTPSSSTEEWVDVSVTTSEGLGKQISAFRYFRDGEGKTTGLGMIEYLRPVGVLSTQGDSASGKVGFISPKSGATWYDQYSDGWDSCRRNWEPDLGWAPADPGAASLDLSEYGGSGSISLAWDAAESHYNGTDGDGDIPTTSLPLGGTWDLLPISSDDWPSFSVEGLFRMPSSFELTSPRLDTETTLAQNQVVFVWTPDTSSSGVIIEATLVDPSSGSQLERVSCLATDDGAFTVPSSAFQSWASGLTLYLQIGRTIETVSLLPLNRGDLRIVGSVATIGAATTN